VILESSLDLKIEKNESSKSKIKTKTSGLSWSFPFSPVLSLQNHSLFTSINPTLKVVTTLVIAPIQCLSSLFINRHMMVSKHPSKRIDEQLDAGDWKKREKIREMKGSLVKRRREDEIAQQGKAWVWAGRRKRGQLATWIVRDWSTWKGDNKIDPNWGRDRTGPNLSLGLLKKKQAHTEEREKKRVIIYLVCDNWQGRRGRNKNDLRTWA